MSLASARKGFGRRPFEYIERDIARCANDQSDAVNAAGKCQAVPHGNDLPHSDDMTLWATNQHIYVASGIADPKGGTSAQKMIATAINGFHQALETVAVLIAGRWVIRAAAGELSQIYMFTGTGIQRGAAFDLSNGTIINVAGITTGGAGERILPIPGIPNWYEISIASVVGNVDVRVGLCSGGNIVFLGDGVSGAYFYRGQLTKSDPGNCLVYPCKTTGAAIAANVSGICYRCRKSCVDPTNYLDGTPKTVRYLPRNTAGVPVGFDGYPVLNKVDLKPTRRAMADGLSSRERLDFSCKDFTQHDRDMDPYWQYRATPATGTWFGRQKARDPYYIGDAVRYYRGYIVNDAIDPANFEVRQYVMHLISPPSQGVVQMQAYDILKLATKEIAQAPAVSPGALAADITAAALSLTVTAGTGEAYRLEENLLIASGDFSNPSWSQTATVTSNAGNDIHGNAVADQLSDISNTAFQYVYQYASDYSVSETYVAAVDIEKDAIGRATRFPALRIGHNGSTNEYSDICLDTSTGETNLILGSGIGAVGGVFDYGTHWRLWIALKSNDPANTACYAQVYPSIGASAIWTYSAATTGSIKASRPQLERNTTPGDYIETTASAVKNGMQVLVGNEIIKVTSRIGDTLSWPSTAYRGQWNTVAAAAKGPSGSNAGDAVQWCEDLTGMHAVRGIERLLLQYTQIVPAQIPFTAWEVQKASKMGAFTIDIGIIPKPEGVLPMIADIASCSLTDVWWESQAVKIILEALQPKTVTKTINESDNILNSGNNASLEVKEKPDERVSYVLINYGLFDVLNPTKSASYNKTFGKPGNQLYGVDNIKEIFCRWFTSLSAITTLAFRTVIMLGDTPIEATFQLDEKDGDLVLGDAINVQADELQDFTGAPSPVEMIIVSKQPVSDADGNRRLIYIAVPNPYTGRYGLIAPNGLMPYSSATEYQKNRYMFIGYNSGANFPDGTPVKQIT